MKKEKDDINVEVPGVGETIKMTLIIMLVALIFGFCIFFYDELWGMIVSFFIVIR